MEGLPAEQVKTLIRWLKEGPPGAIPISRERRSLGSLQAVTWEDAGDQQAMARLGQWHEAAFAVFAVPVGVSFPNARKWLVEQVLEAPDRVLFWVRDIRGRPIGHAGLSRFNFQARTAQLRDVVCGESGQETLVAEAVETLLRWARESLHIQAIDALERLAA
jgi:RimJ/RimL family protein N-acetyltransferase